MPYGAPGGFPTASDPGPPDRANQFFAGGNNGDSILQQPFDVAGNAADIDAGKVSCDIAGWLGGFATDDDTPNLLLIFANGGGIINTTTIFGPTALERANATALQLRGQTGVPVPALTRTITVELDFHRHTGAFNDAYADNISLTLRKPVVVTTTADSGPGSLREAIPLANQITFAIPGGFPQTIDLLTPLPTITSSIRVTGPGADSLAIRQAPSATAFTEPILKSSVTIGNAVTVLRGLTFSGGTAGAIENDSGLLNLDYCVLSNNGALNSPNSGALTNKAYTTLSYCLVTGNKSSFTAISNSVRLLVFHSTISKNAGDGGSAVACLAGLIQLVTSTISENTEANTSPSYGGVLLNQGTATFYLYNCTVSGNSNPHGHVICNQSLNNSTPEFDLSSCTLVGDAIYFANSSLTALFTNNTIFKGTTVRGNFSLSSGATVTSGGYNLSNDAAAAFLNQPTDQNNIDPMLGPLQNNGGPTETHALLPGSPAIDKGNTSFPADQRDALRPYDDPASSNGSGNQSDIGAFEFGDAFLVIKNIARSGSNILVSFPVLPGKTYYLERALSLTNPDWIQAGSLTTSGGGTGQIAHNNGLSGGIGFYRITLP
ncbi:MAG: right-handed parallel beta-helix repeat-containing protein [Acidobacteriota bacterium]|nr:right-handed parallel beta-helix repeat-containing protein [Acidobacteriota bacterium]